MVVPLFVIVKVAFKDVVESVIVTASSNVITPSSFVTPLHSVTPSSSAIKLSD